MADKKLEVIVKFRDDYVLDLIETLQFYANPDIYHSAAGAPTKASRDAGQRARDILKERL
jgi:hypothetical protein